MKLAKIASLLLAPVFAILLAGVAQPPAAQAAPRDILTLGIAPCVALTASFWSDALTGVNSCQGMANPENIDRLVQVLRADDEPPTTLKPDDFTVVDVEGGQIHDEDGQLFIVGFVSNDEPVSFYADRGGFLQAGGNSVDKTNGSAAAFCGPSGDPTIDFTDEDCDDDGIEGDGVVVATLTAYGSKHGAAEVRVRQDGVELSEPYTIVGEPHRLEITLSKAVVQTGQPRCDMFSDTASFLSALQSPETTPLTAKVMDSDGTPVTGAFVHWTASNEDALSVALPDSPSLDLAAQGLGIIAPNVLCGLEETGEITLTGQIVTGVNTPSGLVGLDTSAGNQDKKVTVTVKGPPTEMTLSASPLNIACDGVTSSTVSATLTDAEGDPAVNGNRIHWETKALGTVNPLNSQTGDGVATTALTPLDDVTGGVVVRAWLELPESFGPSGGLVPTATTESGGLPWHPTPELPPIEIKRTDIESTILVNCEGNPAGLPVLQPSGGQQPAISPPSTGSGGSSTGQWWMALPLTAGALLAIGTGIVLKRRAS